MSGGSPTSRQTQAINALQVYLSTHTVDSCGALNSILMQWVENDANLAVNLDQPTVALAHTIDSILANESTLYEFVRQVDMRYGQLFQEIPIFQSPGDSPDPRDEYTHQSVTLILQALRSTL